MNPKKDEPAIFQQKGTPGGLCVCTIARSQANSSRKQFQTNHTVGAEDPENMRAFDPAKASQNELGLGLLGKATKDQKTKPTKAARSPNKTRESQPRLQSIPFAPMFLRSPDRSIAPPAVTPPPSACPAWPASESRVCLVASEASFRGLPERLVFFLFFF